MRGYFYKRLKFQRNTFSKKKYYLNFTPKAKYFLFDKSGLPINIYSGKEIYFPITIINYYMSLIDTNNFDSNKWNLFFDYIKLNIKNNQFLFKHYFFEKNWKNEPIWFSNLPHAILVSILFRIKDKFDIKKKCGKDISFFYDSLYQDEIFDKLTNIFVEYPSIKSQPINGQIFGLFAVYDAYQNNYENYEKLRLITDSTLKLINSQITFFGWTMYNEYRVASPFYHILHIDQLKVCVKIDERFKKYYIRAKIAIIFYPFIVIYKIIERISKWL